MKLHRLGAPSDFWLQGPSGYAYAPGTVMRPEIDLFGNVVVPAIVENVQRVIYPLQSDGQSMKPYPSAALKESNPITVVGTDFRKMNITDDDEIRCGCSRVRVIFQIMKPCFQGRSHIRP